jgi:hypothetical protein
MNRLLTPSLDVRSRKSKIRFRFLPLRSAAELGFYLLRLLAKNMGYNRRGTC